MNFQVNCVFCGHQQCVRDCHSSLDMMSLIQACLARACFLFIRKTMSLGSVFLCNYLIIYEIMDKTEIDSLFKVLLTTSHVYIIFLYLSARIQLFRKCIVYHSFINMQKPVSIFILTFQTRMHSKRHSKINIKNTCMKHNYSCVFLCLLPSENWFLRVPPPTYTYRSCASDE